MKNITQAIRSRTQVVMMSSSRKILRSGTSRVSSMARPEYTAPTRK